MVAFAIFESSVFTPLISRRRSTTREFPGASSSERLLDCASTTTGAVPEESDRLSVGSIAIAKAMIARIAEMMMNF
jgi:hypothetical protein